MTYLTFHLLFNVPILLALLILSRRTLTRQHWKWIGLVAAIVLLFTIPWDSYAVGKGIWSFPAERVAVWVGNLPLEEILFFLFETVNVSLLLILLLARRTAHTGRGGRAP